MSESNVTPFPLAAAAKRLKVFKGRVLFGAGRERVEVTVNGQPLQWHLDLASHSHGGLGWGTTGSGAAQLAIALLAEALGDTDRAIRLYQRFKFAKVARWAAGRDWAITDAEIIETCEAIERAEHAVAGGM